MGKKVRALCALLLACMGLHAASMRSYVQCRVSLHPIDENDAVMPAGLSKARLESRSDELNLYLDIFSNTDSQVDVRMRSEGNRLIEVGPVSYIVTFSHGSKQLSHVLYPGVRSEDYLIVRSKNARNITLDMSLKVTPSSWWNIPAGETPLIFSVVAS